MDSRASICLLPEDTFLTTSLDVSEQSQEPNFEIHKLYQMNYASWRVVDVEEAQWQEIVLHALSLTMLNRKNRMCVSGK